jgi:predicted nicotinamide N-methyase
MEGVASATAPAVAGDAAVSALVPFSFRNPFHDALRDASRWFPIAGARIRIDQDWKSDGRGGTAIGFGASVYDAAVALSLFLEAHRDVVHQKRVIELGAGPGLVGVVAAHLDAESVVVTDGDEVSVALSKHNIGLNAPTMTSACEAETYLWGDMEHRLSQAPLAPFDVIIGADIVACPYAEAFEPLVVSLKALSSPEAVILLAYKRRNDSEKSFFDVFEREFDVVRVSDSELHADFQDSDIVIFTARRKS